MFLRSFILPQRLQYVKRLNHNRSTTRSSVFWFLTTSHSYSSSVDNGSYTIHSHCSFCGSMFPATDWPKACTNCKNISYSNPIPVAVALLPSIHPKTGEHGLLALKRAIEPQVGKLALPGGFVDHNEQWQAAVQREVKEETTIDTYQEDFIPFHVTSTPDGSRLLIFALSAGMHPLDKFAPTPEAKEAQVVTRSNLPKLISASKIAFPLHAEVMEMYLHHYNATS